MLLSGNIPSINFIIINYVVSYWWPRFSADLSEGVTAGLSGGAIAGIVIGSLLVVVLIAALIVLVVLVIYRAKKRKSRLFRKDSIGLVRNEWECRHESVVMWVWVDEGYEGVRVWGLLHSSTLPLLHSSTPPLLHSSTPPLVISLSLSTYSTPCLSICITPLPASILHYHCTHFLPITAWCEVKLKISSTCCDTDRSGYILWQEDTFSYII